MRVSPMHYRPEDATVVKAGGAEYKELSVWHGDVVLDLGANIGTFALWCLARGVDKVVSVEPDRETVKVLTKNLQLYGPRGVVLHGAVVPDAHEGHTIPFHASKKRPDLGRVLSRGRSKTADRGEPYDVDAYKISWLVDRYQPTAIKLDLESYEAAVMTPLPYLTPVRTIAIEHHFWGSGGVEEQTKVARALAAAGWRQVRPFSVLGWVTKSVWTR